MEIKYFGYCCFRIKGKDIVLLTNPVDSSLGIKLPPLTADVVVTSGKGSQSQAALVVKAVSRETPFVIDGPGEYEIGGAFILGTSGGKNNTIFVMTIDGLRLVFLGSQSDKLSEKQLEEVDGVDILFLPVGGKAMFSPKQAAGLVSQIEPKIIIPMAYKIPGLSLDLASLDDFLKEMGVEQTSPQEKLIISKDKLPLEKEVVVLNARS